MAITNWPKTVQCPGSDDMISFDIASSAAFWSQTMECLRDGFLASWQPWICRSRNLETQESADLESKQIRNVKIRQMKFRSAQEICTRRSQVNGSLLEHQGEIGETSAFRLACFRPMQSLRKKHPKWGRVYCFLQIRTLLIAHTLGRMDKGFWLWDC